MEKNLEKSFEEVVELIRNARSRAYQVISTREIDSGFYERAALSKLIVSPVVSQLYSDALLIFKENESKR
jgi:hypothetical protein